jgi:hypothetical protein
MSTKRKPSGSYSTREINLPLQITNKSPTILGKTTTHNTIIAGQGFTSFQPLTKSGIKKSKSVTFSTIQPVPNINKP